MLPMYGFLYSSWIQSCEFFCNDSNCNGISNHMNESVIYIALAHLVSPCAIYLFTVHFFLPKCKLIMYKLHTSGFICCYVCVNIGDFCQNGVEARKVAINF